MNSYYREMQWLPFPPDTQCLRQVKVNHSHFIKNSQPNRQVGNPVLTKKMLVNTIVPPQIGTGGNFRVTVNLVQVPTWWWRSMTIVTCAVGFGCTPSRETVLFESTIPKKEHWFFDLLFFPFTENFRRCSNPSITESILSTPRPLSCKVHWGNLQASTPLTDREVMLPPGVERGYHSSNADLLERSLNQPLRKAPTATRMNGASCTRPCHCLFESP